LHVLHQWPMQVASDWWLRCDAPLESPFERADKLCTWAADQRDR